MSRPDFIPESGFGTVARHQFQEVVAPDPVPYGLETWGWYVVVALTAAGLGYAVYRYLHFQKINRYRKVALGELAVIESGVKKADPAAVRQLSELLKRVALHAFERTDVAPLTGTNWADFLARTCPESSFDGELFDRLTFRGTDGVEAAQLAGYVENARIWIRGHDASV